MTKDEKEINQILGGETMPEARASATYSVTSPKGFHVLLSMRSMNDGEMFDLMESTESFLLKSGYTPEIKRSFSGGGARPQPQVLDEKCPKCGSPLIEVKYTDKTTGEAKTLLKCSTNKWDFATKTASGCDFKKSPDTKVEPATPAQMAILKEKLLWTDGMSKAEASSVLNSVLNK
jgi:predicted nucleic-acid-binding Zn-ribbon protein